ncbi:MAG: SpoVA/SpoVAEb family sporulation membrane protein, partial [Acutalibacteraceae bacterium]
LGVVLGALGIYGPIVRFAGCGATTPLVGFGYSLVVGTKTAVQQQGLMGVLTGPLCAASAGVMAAILSGLIVALFAKPKEK